MENIDKDIEIVKELKENLSYETQCITGGEDYTRQVLAIENVLSELEETKQTLKCTQDSWYKDTQELETYKKIAEYLAKEVLDFTGMVSEKNIELLIEGARKEVEKEWITSIL